MDTAQIIWNYLKKQGFSDYGIAGIMGNLYAESALQPDNLQNSANTNLKMTDKQYTDVVDNGTYTNFFNDGAGYGIAQWTHPTLKEELYNICKRYYFFLMRFKIHWLFYNSAFITKIKCFSFFNTT